MKNRSERLFACETCARALTKRGAAMYNVGMNRSLNLSAYAKANLSLNITGRTERGMHELDSVMVSIDRCDRLTVAERSDPEINVVFANADIDREDNTAYKAAKAVQDIIGGNGWDITIKKGIPIGAGLGGSSADAAAVLRALDIFYRLPRLGVDMRAAALSLGSDVPFMLTGGLARVRGTGGDLFFMENKLPLFGIGLMGGSVSTRECYSEFDRLTSGKSEPTDNAKLCDALMSGEPAATAYFDNALKTPAARLESSITENYAILSELTDTVVLTGSGGMVVGWFTDIEKFGAGAAALNKKDIKYTVFTTVKTGILTI